MEPLRKHRLQSSPLYCVKLIAGFMQYRSKMAGMLGTLLLLGTVFPGVMVAQQDRVTFQPDSVSTGAILDLVHHPSLGTFEGVFFDGFRAHIISAGDTLTRVTVPNGLRRNARPIVRVRARNADFIVSGPYIVPFSIVYVEPEQARPGQRVLVNLSRSVAASPEDTLLTRRPIAVSLGDSLLSAHGLFESLWSPSLEFVLPETIGSSFLEKLKGSKDVEMQVFIAGEPSEYYEGFRIDLPWTNSRILAWAAVLGMMVVLILSFFSYLRWRKASIAELEYKIAELEVEKAKVEAARNKVKLLTLEYEKARLEQESAALAEDREKMPPKPPEAPPEKLNEALADGECILFVSGGLAAQAELPTWPAFLGGLVEFGQSRGLIDADNAKRLLSSLREGQLDLVAEELSSLLPTSQLRVYVKEIQKNVRPSNAHRLLAGLPFAGALTTSFDTLLSKAFDEEESLILEDTEQLLAAEQDRKFFVLNLFGAVERSEKLSFTPEELKRNVKKNPKFRQFISTLFQRYTFFFVGSSLEGIRIYLKALELTPQQNRAHFALVGASQGVDTTKAMSLERQYNIKTIDFRPREGYPEVVDFLKQIRTPKAKGKQPQRRADTPPVLDRIVLTNIGPFKTLDLSFNSSWNVFLGDNGVGKTVILRAIAAALCGEAIRDAPLAVRESLQDLLRTGTDEGEIKLYAGAQPYVVTLEKTNGQVRIFSESLSPLRVDSWLVLGFPALRSITRERPTGYIGASEKTQGPALEDLYPILAGTPDTRLNNLKQWIYDLDTLRTRGDQAARETLDSFWKILDALTPDIRLRPPKKEEDAINIRTGEITLETDDGKVPIEAVSQGTAALICWTGTLLQRLYEVHGSQEGGAIALIDEIAAHMHPSWQRNLVRALKQAFPKVQFIVNTHSPFVVLGVTDPDKPVPVATDEETLDVDVLEEVETKSDAVAPSERNEIIVMRRDPETRQIEALRPRFDVRRWRVQHVLTSSLFNLGSVSHPDVEWAERTYAELVHRSDLTREQKEDLSRASKLLDLPLPTPFENQRAGIIFEKIEAVLDKELVKMDPKEQKKVLDEARLQVQEIISGKRRS